MDLLIRNSASYHILCKAGHQVNPGGAGRKYPESSGSMKGNTPEYRIL
jgi:hypothetical protein